MLSKLARLIRWGRITKAGADDQQFPVQQVEYMGKVADTFMVFAYGHHANVTADALALMLSVQGNPDNRAAIAGTPKNRPKLASGEVAYYHPPTGSFIIWREGGTLDIETGGEGGKPVNVNGSQVNLGEGGAAIARVGDSVQVTITTGSSAGTYNGTITSGGVNTSI